MATNADAAADEEEDSTRARRRRVLLIFLMISVFTTIIGAGIFFASPKRTQPTSQFTTTTVALTNDHPASAVLKLTNMVAGDSISGLLRIENFSGSDLTSYSVRSTSAGPPNPLTRDKTRGLQLRIERCSQAWKSAGAGSASKAACPAKRRTVVDNAPVIGAHSLAGGGFCSGSATDAHSVRCELAGNDYLRLTVWLPSEASNDFQGLSTSINFAFTGTAEPKS